MISTEGGGGSGRKDFRFEVLSVEPAGGTLPGAAWLSSGSQCRHGQPGWAEVPEMAPCWRRGPAPGSPPAPPKAVSMSNRTASGGPGIPSTTVLPPDNQHRAWVLPHCTAVPCGGTTTPSCITKVSLLSATPQACPTVCTAGNGQLETERHRQEWMQTRSRAVKPPLHLWLQQVNPAQSQFETRISRVKNTPGTRSSPKHT